MSFWTYMLHCRGGSFYTGHTDNLEVRIAQHQDGTYDGFTSEHLPVTLVWHEEFPTRPRAFAAEKRIKGWSRVKKMALIRGDWEEVSKLAKGKDNPSTSSGRAVGESNASELSPIGRIETEASTPTARPELVEGLSLTCHPETRPNEIRAVTVEIRMTDGDKMLLTFQVDGAEFLKTESWRAPERCDNLWKTTCFEIFIQPTGSGQYFEFNFSPSTQWAAYKFDSYREGMVDLAVTAPPHIGRGEGDDAFVIEVDLDLSNIPNTERQIALSAVIEEKDGTKSYWALKHPPGKPDFHHRDCFALTLPAPENV
jgi:predicted GIY-YIG superfamily endonuclease